MDSFFFYINTNMNIEQEIREIRDRVTTWANAYYKDDESLVPDHVYDREYQNLERLEKEYPEYATADSPTKRIIGEVLDSLVPVTHEVRMLSIRTETDSTEAGAIKFSDKIRAELGRDVEFCIEPKYDGLAVTLRYIKGKLDRGVTRGDGEVGEDVTHNIRTIKDIPFRLRTDNPPDLVEVRGEVYMKRSTLSRINQELEADGKKPLANTRNAAAGALRKLDSAQAAERQLSFFAYGWNFEFGEELTPKVTTQFGVLMTLEKWGFPVSKLVTTAKLGMGLLLAYERIRHERDHLNYDIDGVVYKVNDIEIQEQLGFLSKEPRWAVAHKFLPMEVPTKLLKIKIQVGRTGKLTPVGVINPTRVGGVVVNNVSLHNVFDLRKRGVRIGDTVLIRRAGDVIPEIKALANWKRKEYRHNFHMPEHCPDCGSKVIRPKGKTNYFCSNNNPDSYCPSQVVGGVLHFCSRAAFAIDGIGDQIAEALVERFPEVKHPLYIFRLTHEDWYEVTGSLVLASNILAQVEKAKKISLRRFILGLGIKHIGESSSRDIARTLKSAVKLPYITAKYLETIPDVGPIAALSFSNYFRDDTNLEIMLHTVKHLGLVIESDLSGDNMPLAGIRFAVTGSFSEVSRSWIESRIEHLGGKTVSKVNTSTQYLVAGEGGGSKRGDAERLGIKILNERQAIDMLK